MILATYENTVIGDELMLSRPIADEFSHVDKVIRKYNQGSKALVMICPALEEKPYVIFPDEVANHKFAIVLGPAKPEADEFGWFTTHVITTGYGSTVSFKQYLDCKACDQNYYAAQHGESYISHYFSQNCKSGKRPHCTCGTCF